MLGVVTDDTSLHLKPEALSVIMFSNVLCEIIYQSNAHTNIYSIFAKMFQGIRATSTARQLLLSCKARCALEMQSDLGIILIVRTINK